MKKTILQIFAIAFIAVTFTSCSKCVECVDCAEGVTLEQTELCQDDFDSKDDYKSAIELIEAFGCDCK